MQPYVPRAPDIRRSLVRSRAVRTASMSSPRPAAACPRCAKGAAAALARPPRAGPEFPHGANTPPPKQPWYLSARAGRPP